MTAPDQRPVRVAHVIQNLNYGGMERVLHGLARDLPERGFEVHIVVIDFFGRFAEGLPACVGLHQTPPMSRYSLIYPRELAGVLRAIGPDLVHSHAGIWLKCVRAARLAGVPIMVHTDHGRPDPVGLVDRIVDNLASRSTDVIIAVSDALAGVLRRQVVQDPDRIRVIINGVDTGRPAPSPTERASFRAELGLPDDAVVIGSIGRLEPVKNFSLAIEALALVPPRLSTGQEPWLVLAGDGSERSSLQRLAIERGVSDRVRFLGWRDDAERLYAAFDLFTLTSLSEGTSISLLEAMSTGVCPVVTDVGGNGAVLGAELAALLVPSGNARELGARWLRYLEDPALRADTARRVRARVEEKFSLRLAVEAHVSLYRELIGAST